MVTRVADFGAFVEIEPGVEGLIHLSEMSWAKKVRKPSDVLKQGDTVEAVVLGVNMGERRLSLGLKQTLGDPWAEVEQKFPVGSAIEGPVTSFTKFGAFVQLADGVEGMIHVSEISAEKHIHHPQDVLRMGQVVKAQVLEVDKAKRQLRLSMKQRTSVTVEEYLGEHPVGSVVTGRILEVGQGLAQGGTRRGHRGSVADGHGELRGGAPAPVEGKVDLSSLSSMLKARWKGGPSSGCSKARGDEYRADSQLPDCQGWRRMPGRLIWIWCRECRAYGAPATIKHVPQRSCSRASVAEKLPAAWVR